MSKKLIAPALLAAVLLTGCLPGANPAATNTATSPAPGATAAPTAGTGTSVTAGANYYAPGRKWVYDITTVAAGTTTKMTQTIECISVSGDTATIKVSMTGGPGGESSTTSTVKTNAVASSGTALPAGTVVTEKGTEAVTVKAGTYANAKKFVSTTSDANAATTSDQWVDPEVGLIKMITLIKPTATMPAMPNIPGLPSGAGAGLDLSSTMTMELVSFTK